MNGTTPNGGKSGRGHKPRPDDPQPDPEALYREAGEVAAMLSVILHAYRKEYDLSGWGSSGAGVSVQGGQSDATQAALTSPDAKAAREACRRAARAIYFAKAQLRNVARELTTGEVQPRRPSRDAVVTRSEFDQALHERREEDLRQ